MKTKLAFVLFFMAAFVVSAAGKNSVQLVALTSCCQGNSCQTQAADTNKVCWLKLLVGQFDDQVSFRQSMDMNSLERKSVVLIQPCCKGKKSILEMENALMEKIEAAKKKNLQVILVTPVCPRVYKEGEFHMVLGAYPEAVRRVAKREGVALLDIEALTEKWIQDLGEEASKEMYACKCSLNRKGAEAVSRMAAQEIQSKKIKPLYKHIVLQ